MKIKGHINILGNFIYPAKKLKPTELNIRIIKKLGVFLFSLISSTHVYAESQEKLPNTIADLGGTEQARACLNKELAELKRSVETSAGADRMPVDAWILTNTVLCKPSTSKNIHVILQHLPQRVRKSSVTDDGKESITFVTRSKETVKSLMMEGAAWGVSVHDYPGDITVTFLSNVACIKDISLKFIQTGWIISRYGEACD